MKFTQFDISFTADEIGDALEHKLAQALLHDRPIMFLGMRALVGFRQFEYTDHQTILTYNVQPLPDEYQETASAAQI